MSHKNFLNLIQINLTILMNNQVSDLHMHKLKSAPVIKNNKSTALLFAKR